ncbi:MAG TPA: histidinol-phosphate transaminase [Verrucomicrobiae bacterium]|nr:histidinol-phosphate transaminase [Verrucomicrobiae bacterium]
MSATRISRRDFSLALGGSLAAAAATSAFQNRHTFGQAKPEPAGTIRINFNENPYGPSPKAREALAECAGVASRYPDWAAWEITESLAKMHGVKPGNILLGCGSTEILHVVDLTFLGAGQNVVVAEPTFEAVLDYAKVLQANPVKVPQTRDYRHDLPRMAAACTSKTGVVYVCNPNNPTGTVVSRSEILEFLPKVPPTTLVLVDEAYHHFVEDPAYQSCVELIARFPNVLVARTFSKIYGLAGMRLGYGVAVEETVERLRQEILIANGNAAVLAAASASLGDQEAIAATREKLNSTRAWFCGEMKKDGRGFIPSQANFVMIDMGGDVRPYIAKFEEHKILVGRQFPSMPNFLRVTIGTRPEMETFVAVLRQIAPAPGSRAA